MGSFEADVPMIGRVDELKVLSDAFAAGRAGHPRVVVVRGEAGIGKTRLLTEFLARADSGGPPLAVVATGQCIDTGEIGAPFTPIRRMLRELYRGVGDDAFRSAASAPRLVGILATLVPDLVGDDLDAIPGGADIVAEALERCIENLSERFHVLLVIEDLHWADAATIALLRTLSVTLRGSHVTVIMTYRSDDVGRGHPLRPLLADLERNPAVTTVEVKRLDPDNTASLIRRIGPDLGNNELDAVIARSEGVPFFIEELVDLDGDELPDTLRDLVLARYERTDPDVRSVIRVLAVGGVHVEHDVLGMVADLEPDVITKGLRAGIAANLILAADDGYTFRHALIQEAVLGDLLPSERAVLHRRYAEVLNERMSGHPELAALVAEHWLAARDIPRAFAATAVAYRHAVATFAPAAAALLGERLLELWQLAPNAEQHANQSRTALTLEIADHWRVLGDVGRSLRVVQDGLTASSKDDVLGRARLHREAYVALGNSFRHAEAAAHARAGIALVSDRTDPEALAVHARLLATLVAGSREQLLPGEDRRALGRQAIELAERSGDVAALVTAASDFSWIAADEGDLDGAMESIRLVLDLKSLNDSQILSATLFEVDTLVRMGRYRQAIDAGRARMDRAASIGLKGGMAALIDANVAEAMVDSGDLPGAKLRWHRVAPHLDSWPAFRSFVFRMRMQALSWDDEDTAALALRDEAQAFVPDVLREDSEERLAWAEADSERSLNQGEAERDSERWPLLVAAALNQVNVLSTGDLVQNPGLARRLLPAAARVVVEAFAVGDDRDAGAALRTSVDVLVSRLPDDP
ncbi:MAG TPA: AAA family ATPase, partial [Humibacter sp.]|nr:AAA family ATPase [Humibacter sp.]